MRDLLTNINKAVEIINKSKGTCIILLTKPEEVDLDIIPVGVSRQEWEDNVMQTISKLFFGTYINSDFYGFFCGFDIADLRVEETDPEYIDAMKRIMQTIFSKYKDSVPTTQNIASPSQPALNGGILNTLNTTLSSSVSIGNFNDLAVSGDSKLSKIIADIIILDGEDVADKLKQLEVENITLKNEIDRLKRTIDDVISLAVRNN